MISCLHDDQFHYDTKLADDSRLGSRGWILDKPSLTGFQCLTKGNGYIIREKNKYETNLRHATGKLPAMSTSRTPNFLI
ncbi:hypothetical protein [Secundilactobacillus collinoides]|uniref:hypothetical protein n=1 Tax=Secundilactobacillus collinoides TaxID=33960 RepID=UPI00138F96E6|nr:hypothetical protein [Secundilactobacillus collinoides]